MLPDGVSTPGPLTYESGALPIALGGPVEGLEPSLWLERFLPQGALKRRPLE